MTRKTFNLQLVFTFIITAAFASNTFTTESKGKGI